MRAISSGIAEGGMGGRSGKRGGRFAPGAAPSCSLPLQTAAPPAGTAKHGLAREERNAFPVTRGFPRVHWTAANLQRTYLAESEGGGARDFLQAVNSRPSGGLPLAPGVLCKGRCRALERHLRGNCCRREWYFA